MKKLLIFLFITLLISCDSQLPPPKTNSDIKNIIGNTVNIEDIEVAQYDFPKLMNWSDAKEACAALGKGWKLPNKIELNTMYLNKEKIGGFANISYWSSSEYVSYYAWVQYFNDGYLYSNDKANTAYVRAIRAF